MKSSCVSRIAEEQLGQFLPQVNLSERDKEIVAIYLDEGLSYREIGSRFGISGERVRQIIERFARKAHYYKTKEARQ